MTQNKRWFAVAIFALAASLNFLDRGLLGFQAPRIKAEFHLTNEGYGWLVAAFSYAYALASPLVGWFLDLVGLELGIAIAVGLWSVATIFTGLSQTFPQLVAARIFLGIWESAGVPAAGKLNSMYLEPKNRAIGAGVTQVGISLGSILALIVVARVLNWRQPFFLGGILGLLWIPLWLYTRSRIRPEFAVGRQPNAGLSLLLDRRLLVLSAANLLWMTAYGFWPNWMTLYLVDRFHLTSEAATAYSWVVYIAAIPGGFFGGWIARRAMQRGMLPIPARGVVLLVSALGCLCTLLTPLCPTPAWVGLVMAASLFWTVAGSVNIYTIPVDIWGPARAATAVSALVFTYGLSQAVINPIIGGMVDKAGYGRTFWLVALPPLAACALVKWGIPNEKALP